MNFWVRAAIVGPSLLAAAMGMPCRAEEKSAPQIRFKRTQLDAKFRSEGAAVGDFNHDGKADLVWRNDTTGQTALWLMNGTTATSSAVVLTSLDWSVTHTADFNGDGKADLVWRNRTTGQTAIWLMDGLLTIDSAVIFSDRNWVVTNTADLNGDGSADLLWRNPTPGASAA